MCAEFPIEESQPDEAGSHPIAAEEAPKSRRALSRLKRELSDDELSSTGVQKLLLENLLVAEDDNERLKSALEKYQEVHTENAVLKEKLLIHTAAELISDGTLIVGSLALGAVPSVWNHPAGWVFISGGAILIVIGSIAKWVVRK